MTMLKPILRTLGVAAAFFGVAALSASAQISATVNGSVNTSANVGNVVKATVNTSASSNTSAGAAAKTATKAKSAPAVGISKSLQATATAAMGSSSSNTSSFVLTRDDIAASSTSYVAPANVTSADDFSAYARTAMMSDENIVKIASNDGQVSVWYKEPVKVLGFVPAAMSVQATVDASGTVTVIYPWWYGVFTKDDSSAQLQSDLDTTAGTIARGEASATLSSAAKARLVNAVHSILKARYQSLTGTTSADVAY